MEKLSNGQHRDNIVATDEICHTPNVMAATAAPLMSAAVNNNYAVVLYVDPFTRQKNATSQFRSLQKFAQTFDATDKEKGIMSMITRSMTAVVPSEIEAAMFTTAVAMAGGRYPAALRDVVDAWSI